MFISYIGVAENRCVGVTNTIVFNSATFITTTTITTTATINITTYTTTTTINTVTTNTNTSLLIFRGYNESTVAEIIACKRREHCIGGCQQKRFLLQVRC